MYVHSLPSTQVSGRPGFDNEVWFMVVPVHLVSPSSQLIVLSPHVFILMSSLRAHMHICSPTSFWAPHLGGACVCVCVSTPVLKDFTPIFMTALVGLSFGTTLSDFPSMQQGDAGDFHGRHPTKTPWTSCDMSQGRLTHVPALSIVKTVHCRVAPVVSKKLVKTPSSLPTFSPFCSAVFGSIESRSNACKVGLHTDPSSCEHNNLSVCVCVKPLESQGIS